MKVINSGEYEVLVDDRDYESVLSNGVTVYRFSGKKVYAIDKDKKRIHRQILGITDPKICVDHKNGNTLDNTRENIRVCTQKENSKNRRKVNKVCTSKYKGVHKAASGSWVAMIRVNYKRYYLGSFKNEVDAALAYNKAAVQHFGEFAQLNN